MQLDTLLEADSVTLTCSREPDGKFKVRSGTSSVDTVILVDQVLTPGIGRGGSTSRAGACFTIRDQPPSTNDAIGWEKSHATGTMFPPS